jgi:hypothetical protein
MKDEDRERGRSPMKDEAPDPRFEKLVALLYGELSGEEAREIQQQMERDAALRAEYEELSAARSLLGEWEVPEKAPHFVFLADEQEEKRVRPGSEGIVSRWRKSLQGLVTATPWAVATAALLVAFLGWTDFRIDRTNGAIAFRFGRPPAESAQTAERIPEILPGTAPGLIPATTPIGSLEPGRLVSETAPSSANTYLTRSEFEQFSSGMNRTMVTLLNEYSRRRDQELTSLLQGAFGRFADKQITDYAELSARIDALQQGVSFQRSVTNSRLDYLTRSGAQGTLAPSEGSSDSVSVKEGANQ